MLSVRAWADVRDVPDDVDLAVIALPAPQVLDAVRACSEKRVRGLVVVSGGFGDGGPEGRARLARGRPGGPRGRDAADRPQRDGRRQRRPRRTPARDLRGRLPAARPGRASSASPARWPAPSWPRRVRRNVGLSTFVSIGDRADVSGNDLLQYWQADPGTDVVLMHLQGFGNPRKFARIARVVGRTKPVVALKSGRGAGDVAVDAMFASAGVVRVDSLGQLFEAAQLLALQPLPAGRRVGIVGTSSALAALAADACRGAGLAVPALPEEVQAGLRGAGRHHGDRQPGRPRPARRARAAARPRSAGRGQRRGATPSWPWSRRTRTPPSLGAVLRETSVALRGAAGVPLLASYLGIDGVPAALAVGRRPGRAAASPPTAPRRPPRSPSAAPRRTPRGGPARRASCRSSTGVDGDRARGVARPSSRTTASGCPPGAPARCWPPSGVHGLADPLPARPAGGARGGAGGRLAGRAQERATPAGATAPTSARSTSASTGRPT